MMLAPASLPVLSAAAFVGTGAMALRARIQLGPALAAGALLAVLALDLVPDVHADLSAVDPTAGLLATLVATALVAVLVAASRVSGPRQSWFAAPIAVHGLVEGLAVGAAFSWRGTVGAGLLVALGLHKAAEGADLGLCLASSRTSRGRAGSLAWLAAGAAGPLVGFALAGRITLAPVLVIAASVTICGLLCRVCVRLVWRACQGSSPLRALGAAGLSGLVMTALIVST